jgi:putative transposase
MARTLTKDQLLVWKDRLARQRDSGLSIAEFCRHESVSATNFYQWKQKLKGGARRVVGKMKPAVTKGSTESPAMFVQVPLPQPRGATWIEIVTADGTQIRLPHQNLQALELTLATISGRLP